MSLGNILGQILQQGMSGQGRSRLDHAVGAGGIGAPLIFAMNQYAWNDVSAIFLGFVLLVWLIDVGSACLRARRAVAAAPGK